MSPGKNIEDCHISGQKENALCSKDAVHKGNPDKTAVGISRCKTVNLKIRIIFSAYKKVCSHDRDQMRGCRSGKRKQKSIYQAAIIFGLKDGNDQTRVDDGQQEAGQIPVSFLVDDLEPVAEECENHYKKHFHKLVKNQYKHNFG